MPNASMPGLADLHLHLYGSIHHQDYLERLTPRSVDWSAYEEAYEAAFRTRPNIESVLDRHRLGQAGSEDDFRRLFVFGDRDAGSFQKFQAKYNILVNGSSFNAYLNGVGTLAAAITELLYFANKIVARQQKQGVVYAEQRLSLGKLSIDDCRQAYLALLNAYNAYDASQFRPRLVLSLPRNDPWPQWEMVKELALGQSGHLLTGVDFCFIEEGYPPKDKEQFFQAVREFNDQNPQRALAVLYHVGESFTDKSLESAIRWVHEAAELGAHRLGHAIALGIDPRSVETSARTESASERQDQLRYDLRHAAGLREYEVSVAEIEIRAELAELGHIDPSATVPIHYDERRIQEITGRQNYAIDCIKALGAVVEVCPTSNSRIGGIGTPAHHPLHRFLDRRLAFVIGSDDPGIFDTSTKEEIDWVIQAADLGPEAFDYIAELSWRYRSEVLTGRESYREHR